MEGGAISRVFVVGAKKTHTILLPTAVTHRAAVSRALRLSPALAGEESKSVENRFAHQRLLLAEGGRSRWPPRALSSPFLAPRCRARGTRLNQTPASCAGGTAAPALFLRALHLAAARVNGKDKSPH